MPTIKNAKHERFAVLVFKGTSIVEAYAEVYGVEVDKPQTRSSASELRSKPIISSRIAELQVEAAREATVEVSEVIRELRLLAFSDIGEAYNSNGKLLEPEEMTERFRRAVAGIESEEIREDGKVVGIAKKLKLWPKLPALQLLGTYLGMWKDKDADKDLTIRVIVEDYKPKG